MGCWDIGDHYGSGIFFHDEEQRDAALRSKTRAQASGSALVMQIEPAQTFYEAEDYHQQCLENGGRASCTATLARAI